MSSPSPHGLTLKPECDLLLTLSRVELTGNCIEHARTLLEGHLDQFDWGYFVDQAARHKVLPLIGRNISRYIRASDDGAQLVPYRWLYGSVYSANKRRNRALAAEFGVLFEALNSVGLAYAVRKGPVVVESLFQDPGLRRMYDLDLLVSPGDVHQVGEILEKNGYESGRLSADGTEIVPFARATRMFWKLKVSNELPYLKLSHTDDVDVYAVDLCLDLFQNRSGEAETADILGRRIPLPLCGVDSFALAPEDQFIDLCLHLWKEATARHYVETGIDLQISKFLDIAMSFVQIDEAKRWAALRERTDQCGAGQAVYYAMYHAALLYPGEISSEQLAEFQPEDVSFLDEYGAADGRVARWERPFIDRLFLRDRKGITEGSSVVPRA